MLNDKFNRPLKDLRISVIDRCNFRCPYCMPAKEFHKNYEFINQENWLNFSQIERLTKIFIELGVEKIRLTGGEPLLRPNISELISSLTKIPGIKDLALTTNASLLGQQAKALRQAGLNRLTVSLDSLNVRIFKHLSGQKGDVKNILNNIRVAEGCGFHNMKINVVVQKGVNDKSLLDIVQYFRGTNHILRFIEYMDVGNCNHWDNKYVVPSKEIVEAINTQYPLEVSVANYYGEVAKRYRYKDGQGEIGFISSISEPFCQSCTRGRLSVDGKFYTCLFATKGTDLKQLLTGDWSDEEIKTAIVGIWQKREDRYSELRQELIKRSTSQQKVEMFHIGG